jgi:hypothetical protein
VDLEQIGDVGKIFARDDPVRHGFDGHWIEVLSAPGQEEGPDGPDMAGRSARR